MDTHLIERGRYVPTDPRLGRQIEHDSRSRAFAFRATGTVPQSVKHVRRIQVFDQGQIGSCTGNAALGCLGTDPFYNTRPNGPWSEDDAVNLYSIATRLDSLAGTYPPQDTGSTGVSVAKACVQLGLISGYQHAFSTLAALSALASRPIIAGTDWYEGMFAPDQYGVVLPTGRVAGGHEYVVDEYDAERRMVGCQNSWGEDWGQNGRFYMSLETFTFLLDQKGDVTIFTPIDMPAPTPDPTPLPVSPVFDRDMLSLARSVEKWRRSTFPWIGASDAQHAVDRFLRRKGY